jgi:uncharacterized protein YdhG (YjbR/CyaY superfamily)
VPGNRRQQKGQVVATFDTVEAYLTSFPDDVRPILEQIRAAIRAAVPGAEETMSYNIPTFTLSGRPVVYFAGWKHHVSVYPIPEADEVLERELAPYRAAKGTLRFPLARPIPYEAIGRAAALLAARRS